MQNRTGTTDPEAECGAERVSSRAGGVSEKPKPSSGTLRKGDRVPGNRDPGAGVGVYIPAYACVQTPR